MRIILIGQAAFAATVLERLLATSDEVVALYTSPQRERSLALRQITDKRGIPLFQPASMRDPEVYDNFRRLAPDLAVMAFVTDIVPVKVLECPRLGSIQYHPSLLPRHRGSSAINWAIIHGDSETGVSIFWPDRGIDTGPILLQEKTRIMPNDTVGSLYFKKLYPMGVRALVEAVRQVKLSRALKLEQDDAHVSYEPPCSERYARIDWNKPVSQVYNLIRGTDPQPGAIATLNGRRLKIFEAEKTLETAGRVGQIVRADESGVLIAGNGGAILAKRLQIEGEAKMPAKEFVAASGISAGVRFDV